MQATGSEHGLPGGVIGALFAAISGLAAAIVALWHRTSSQQDKLMLVIQAEHQAGLEAVQKSMESRETLLRETLTTIQGMHENVEALADRVEATERAVASFALSTERLVAANQEQVREIQRLVQTSQAQNAEIHALAESLRLLATTLSSHRQH